jgi:hypothetical protein
LVDAVGKRMQPMRLGDVLFMRGFIEAMSRERVTERGRIVARRAGGIRANQPRISAVRERNGHYRSPVQDQRTLDRIHFLGEKGWRDHHAEGTVRNMIHALHRLGKLDREALLEDMRERGHDERALRRLDWIIDTAISWDERHR